MKIKKFNAFNEDLTDAGIPKDFMKKAGEGKPTPSMGEFMQGGMESFRIINTVKEKESEYTDDQLKQIALDTVKKLFSGTKVIDINDVNFDLKIMPLPDPRNIEPETDMKRGTVAGYNDEEFAQKRDEEDEEIKPEIDKRRIINALTQGFAMASQEDIIMSDENSLPSEIFQDYFKLMKVTHKTHWTIPEEILKNAEMANRMAVPLGRVELKYDEESKKYTIAAEGAMLIVLIHEMIKGVYELIAMYGQTGKTAEELEKVYKLTDTMSMETEGLKFGPEMVKSIREFYNNLENKLIKDGKITSKQDILASMLATFYTYPARDFVKLCEQLFSTDDSKKPYAEFGELYLSIIDAIEDKPKTNRREPKREEPKKEEAPSKKNYTVDDLLDKISKDGYKSLTQDEKDFLKNQNK